MSGHALSQLRRASVPTAPAVSPGLRHVRGGDAVALYTTADVDQQLAHYVRALAHCRGDEFRDVLWRDIDKWLDIRLDLAEERP